MAGIKGHIGVEQKAKPFAKRAFDPRWLSPKQSVVNEKNLGSGLGSPANRLGASIDREGDATDRSTAATDLHAIQGVVDGGKRVDLEQGPA